MAMWEHTRPRTPSGRPRSSKWRIQPWMRGMMNSKCYLRRVARRQQAPRQKRRSALRLSQSRKHPSRLQNLIYPQNSTRLRRRIHRRSRAVTTPEIGSVVIVETIETIETAEIAEMLETFGTTGTVGTPRAVETMESTHHTSMLQTVEICQETCRRSPGQPKSSRGAKNSRSLGNLENLECVW